MAKITKDLLHHPMAQLRSAPHTKHQAAGTQGIPGKDNRVPCMTQSACIPHMSEVRDNILLEPFKDGKDQLSHLQ